MSRSLRSVLRIAGLALLLAGCDSGGVSDVLPDPAAPHSIAAEGAYIGVTSSSNLEDAYAISKPYYYIDPLAPFGVGYEEFGANPELVTDEQFTDWGEANYSTIQADTTEDDGLTVEEYTSSGGGFEEPIHPERAGRVTPGPGGGGGFATASMGKCEDQYDNNSKRCRKVRSMRGRAVCWAAIMAVYAGCIGLERVERPAAPTPSRRNSSYAHVVSRDQWRSASHSRLNL